MSKLVIVESPSKAKSIQKYLGKDYTVVSSKGHVRDLPAAKLSVDVKNDFAPKYMVIKGKEKLVKEFYRYTFVKEINVACDMTPDEIKQQAYLIYDELQMMRNKPILSRMGV